MPLAERCIQCGAELGKPPCPKSKTIAVLLAVFLGCWTWLYTYKKNTWKFWLGLVLGMPSFIIFNLGAIPHNSIEYDASGNYIGLGGFRFSNEIMVPALVVLFTLWIWAVIDVCQKRQGWYLTYNWTVSPRLNKKD